MVQAQMSDLPLLGKCDVIHKDILKMSDLSVVLSYPLV